MPSINASEFKAKCLGLLDEVARTGESLTILKRGRPLARLVPIQVESTGWPQQELVGSVEILGDVVSPVLPAEAWGALARRRRR